jgi:hypothetical protein
VEGILRRQAHKRLNVVVLSHIR